MSQFQNIHDFITKIAQAIDFSTEISDEEKQNAEEAVLRLEETAYHLNKAIEHLDVLYIPFEKHKRISTKSVVDKRGVLNRFKQASKKKFEHFKYLSILAIQKLNRFSKGDTDIQEIINTFESSIVEIEDNLEDFYNILSDYESSNFRNDVLESINSVKESSEDLTDLVYDRIIEHINTNIVGKNWMSDTQDKMDIDMQEKTPLIIELFKQRQEMLDGKTPSPEKAVQELNPSDAQRVYYPDATRTVNFTEFGE